MCEETLNLIQVKDAKVQQLSAIIQQSLIFNRRERFQMDCTLSFGKDHIIKDEIPTTIIFEGKIV